MSKYTFRIITLIGFLAILIGIVFPSWQLDVRMGDIRPNIEARVFESFDLSKLSGNFQNFSTRFIASIRICVIVMIVTSFISLILLFTETLLKPEHRKPVNGFIIILSAVTIMAAISLFVLNIIFVKQNEITQANGFTLKPVLKNGIYLMLMGGFANGLFSMYALVYQK